MIQYLKEKLASVKNNENMLVTIAILLVLSWVAPYFILGQDAHMRVHDNLDSNLGWYKSLKDSGLLFGPLNAPFPQIFNGELSRDSFYSQFNGMVMLFSLLPPMVAYGASQLITRLGAFLGMYLLLRKYVIKGENQGIIRVGAAVTFALTPYWPSGMLSILGMPLALWAFLNIRRGEKLWKNYVVLTVLPFFSSFVLGFLFFLTFMGVFWLIDLLRSKKWNVRLIVAIGYMGILYLLLDYRLVASMFLPHETTNREVFYQSKLNFFETLRLVGKNYVIEHNQDLTVWGVIVLPLSLICLGMVIYKRNWKKHKLFIGLHILNIALSTWYAFWFFEGWQPLKEQVSILRSFNFARFHYLRPLILYTLFALSLRMVWNWGNFGKKLAVICVIAQVCVLLPFNEQITYKNEPSYRQFFAEKQFEEIKDYIGQPVGDYRVVSIGIHPVISQYNGFYTLDSYSNMYPLSYKQEFRKIIAPELEKNRSLAEYYDYWGGRCYIFVDELGKHYMFSKHSDKRIEKLDLNTDKLKGMGGKYILSAVPIENAAENLLSLEKVFDEDSSYWKIYLYRVK
ncbi:DUF6044 family protein [Bacillus gobiensis]|uniref:DUF6044 family protein n=1 Tax=Bacillus gobiensis TaxID=1441095 RepID=UPI003D21201E